MYYLDGVWRASTAGGPSDPGRGHRQAPPRRQRHVSASHGHAHGVGGGCALSAECTGSVAGTIAYFLDRRADCDAAWSQAVVDNDGPVLRLFPPCTLISHTQGSSGVVDTMPFVWRSHAKSPPTRAGCALDIALRLA